MEASVIRWASGTLGARVLLLEPSGGTWETLDRGKHLPTGSHPQGPTGLCGSTLGVALEPWAVGARGGREEGTLTLPW